MSGTTSLFVDASRICSGGGLIHFLKLVRYLDSKSCDWGSVIMVVHPAVADRLDFEFRNILVLSAPAPLSGFWISSFIEKIWLLCYSIWNKPDVSLSLCGNILGGRKRIVFLQNILPIYGPQFWGSGVDYARLFAIFLTLIPSVLFSAEIIVPSTAFKLGLTRRFGGRVGSKVTCIPHGGNHVTGAIDGALIRDKIARFTYVSPGYHYKGHVQLLEAFIGLRNRQFSASPVPFSLTLVGSQLLENKQIEEKIFEARATGIDVWVFESLKGVEVHHKICESDFCIWASRAEAFGITLLEYMNFGKVIISSNDNAAIEILGSRYCDDIGAGLIFDPLDVAQIASSIGVALDLTVSEYLGLGSYLKRKSTSYTWERSIGDLTDRLRAGL